LEARIIAVNDKPMCKINIHYKSLPFIETSYKFHNNYGSNTKYFAYDKIDYEMKITTLDYPTISDNFIDDMEFLLKWDVNIISDKNVNKIIKKILEDDKMKSIKNINI